jgi:hypothetical protein
MFDDDELEEIREDQGDWQGHIDRQTVKKSKTSRKILAGSVGASALAAGFMTFIVFSGMLGSAFIGLAGLGGFTADIEKLVGNDVSIYPAVGPTAGCPADYAGGNFVTGNGSDPNNPDGDAVEGNPDNSISTVPQLRADISGAEIPPGSELTLNKDLQVPEITNLRMIRIAITQNASITPGGQIGNVTLGDSSLYVTGLRAGKLEAFDTEIREGYTDGTPNNPRFGPTGEFVLSGKAGSNQVTLSNATARAHFLSFGKLTLPNLELSIEYFTDSDLTALRNNPDRIDPIISDESGTGNFGDCPVVTKSGQDDPLP